MESLSFSQLGIGFAFLVLLSMLVVNVVTIFSMRRTQRREVSVTESFATKEELRKLEHETDEGRQRLYAHVEKLRKEIKDDVGNLSTQIGAVATQVAGVRSQTEFINQSMAQLSTQVNSFILAANKQARGQS